MWCALCPSGRWTEHPGGPAATRVWRRGTSMRRPRTVASGGTTGRQQRRHGHGTRAPGIPSPRRRARTIQEQVQERWAQHERGQRLGLWLAAVEYRSTRAGRTAHHALARLRKVPARARSGRCPWLRRARTRVQALGKAKAATHGGSVRYGDTQAARHAHGRQLGCGHTRQRRRFAGYGVAHRVPTKENGQGGPRGSLERSHRRRGWKHRGDRQGRAVWSWTHGLPDGPGKTKVAQGEVCPWWVGAVQAPQLRRCSTGTSLTAKPRRWRCSPGACSRRQTETRLGLSSNIALASKVLASGRRGASRL